MSENTNSGSGKCAGLLVSANSAGGKEVYEYTPDPGSVVSHADSVKDNFDRDPFRPSRATKDLDESEIIPSTAYEFFRGKTYKSTVFPDGFSIRQGLGKSLSDLLEVRGDGEEMGSFIGDFGSCSSFETPIGRLKRLQGEVDEMLDFVSSFLVEERVPATASQEQVSSAVQTLQQPDGEKKDGAEPAKQQAEAMQVQYQRRRLPSGAQEALLFGQDPLALIDELKRLRMQIAGVLNNKRTEALVSNIEPVTGMRSGAALLAQHLSAASAQLQQTLANEAIGTAPPLSSLSSAHHPTASAAGGVKRTPSAADSSSPAVGAAAAGGLPSTAYEVYCVPSLAPMVEQSRVTSLERRLAFVENKMGLHKMSLLPHADLFEAVAEMQQRIKFLDTQKIESLQKRVQSLLLELHALQQRRHELDMLAEGAPFSASASGSLPLEGALQSGCAATRDWQRIEELYEICERWKAPAAVLPSVLERLKLLKNVHQDAGGVAVRLSVLEKQQDELQAWAKRAEDAVNKLQKTVLESIEWAQSTVAQMQQRLRAVETPSPAEK